MGVLRAIRVACMANILLITAYNNLQDDDRFTLLVENLSFSECCNASTVDGNDAKDGASAVPARIQAKGVVDIGHGRSDTVQLGPATSAMQVGRPLHHDERSGEIAPPLALASFPKANVAP